MAKVKNNIGDFALRLDKKISNLDNRVNEVLVKNANDIKDYVKEQWPVDTGFSRSRWAVENNGGDDVSVVNDAEYASFVHNELYKRLIDEAVDIYLDDLIDDMLDVMSDLL